MYVMFDHQFYIKCFVFNCLSFSPFTFGHFYCLSFNLRLPITVLLSSKFSFINSKYILERSRLDQPVPQCSMIQNNIPCCRKMYSDTLRSRSILIAYVYEKTNTGLFQTIIEYYLQNEFAMIRIQIIKMMQQWVRHINRKQMTLYECMI